MDVIDSNYIEMFPITTRNDEEINKSFDSLNDHNYYDFNFDINKRDENGNSLLHRLIIDSVDENDAINKFLNLSIDVKSLYNKQNNNLQSPLHLICIKRYQELFNVMINEDKRRQIIKDVSDNIKNDDNVIVENDPSFDLFNYNIQDKYGNIPLFYLLNGNEISYDNLNPYLVFTSVLLPINTKDIKDIRYKNTNKLILNDDKMIFKDFEYLKDFILLISDNTKNLNRYHFNSSFDISIQTFINSFITNDFDYNNYYEFLIKYLLNKVKLNNVVLDTDTNEFKHPIYYYQIYSIINDNPYTEIIKYIINIEEFQQILSDGDLISDVNKISDSKLSIQSIINDVNIRIHKNQLVVAYIDQDQIKLPDQDQINTDQEKIKLSIPMLNFIPIFKLFVKLYNKYYNQKNNTIDNFIIFNDDGLSNESIIIMIDHIIKLRKKEKIDSIIKSDEKSLEEIIKNNINKQNNINKDMDLTTIIEKISEDITNKTYTNNFNSNMQLLLNKSDEIKIAYKANINKFNNIIIQNIDKFAKK